NARSNCCCGSTGMRPVAGSAPGTLEVTSRSPVQVACTGMAGTSPPGAISRGVMVRSVMTFLQWRPVNHSHNECQEAGQDDCCAEPQRLLIRPVGDGGGEELHGG